MHSRPRLGSTGPSDSPHSRPFLCFCRSASSRRRPPLRFRHRPLRVPRFSGLARFLDSAFCRSAFRLQPGFWLGVRAHAGHGDCIQQGDGNHASQDRSDHFAHKTSGSGYCGAFSTVEQVTKRGILPQLAVGMEVSVCEPVVTVVGHCPRVRGMPCVHDRRR